MRYYSEDDKNRKGKMWGAIWAAGYLGLWVVLMLFVYFPVHNISKDDQGILINFGDVEAAGGQQDTNMTDVVAQTSQPTSSPTTQQDQPTDHGDVEIERPQTRPQPTTQAQPVEQPRQADPRAMFPGRTAGSTSTSEGTSQGAGNQGNPAGSPDGSHDGTGTGTSGSSFNLAGRSTVGSLPKPAYRSSREGRVVVEITVDAQGNVTNAAYRATGSTGVDNLMIQDAIEAARKAKFTASQSEQQTGTITYIFRQN